jgi:hypothetical protein
MDNIGIQPFGFYSQFCVEYRILRRLIPFWKMREMSVAGCELVVANGCWSTSIANGQFGAGFGIVKGSGALPILSKFQIAQRL